MTTPSTIALPDAALFQRRLLGLVAITASVTALAGTLFFFFGLELTPRQARLGPWLIVAPALAVDLAVGLLVARRQVAPVLRCLEAAPRFEDPGASAGLVQALNLPALSTLRVVALQLPAFAVVALSMMAWANASLALSFSVDQVLVALLTMAFLGSGHAIIEYSLVAGAVRPIVRALQERGVTLDAAARARVIAVGMRRKFIYVLSFAGLVPMSVLAFSVVLKVEQTMLGAGLVDAEAHTSALRVWVVLLVVATTATVGYISMVLAREMIGPTEVLAHAMEKVRDNQLDTQLAVTTTDEFAMVYEGFNSMTTGLRERARLHDAFGRFVAPQLADSVMREGVELGGERVDASVLFADIRGFTALSERLSAEQVVELLNGYFAAVEPAIVAEGGWINKFGGDSLLAVFGAPVTDPDHASHAVRAARAMRAELDTFNRAQRREGAPELEIGIGVAAGSLVAGNLGSPQRMEYTVIGDVVNTAARLESLTKELGRTMLVTRSVRDALGDAFEGEPLPATKVRGKADPVEIYALAEQLAPA